MKRIAISILFLVGAPLALLRAGSVSQEIKLDASYVGGADMGDEGRVSEQSNLVRYVVSSQMGSGPILRIGTEWQRFSFFNAALDLPDTLQANDLVLGTDLEAFGWLIRVEAQPGFYGDSHNIQWKNFNVPFIIGGSYIMSADLQWVVGLRVDVNSQFPVFGAIGVRWKFADKWVLNAILPRPRLEYQFNDAVTLFGGAEIKDGTFRVSRDFGNSSGNPSLNNALLDYTEIRAGAGASWKISSNLKLDLEAGYMAYREFNFHRASITEHTDSGAPYGQIIFGSQF